MLTILDKNITDNPANFDLEMNYKKIYEKFTKIIIDNITHYTCTHCNETKPINEYPRKIYKGL